MDIRTVTFFFNTRLYPKTQSAQALREFLNRLDVYKVKNFFKSEKITLYNVRLSISPPRDEKEMNAIIEVLKEYEFDYYGGIGTLGLNDLTEKAIEALKEMDRLTGFISVTSIEEAIKAGEIIDKKLKNDISAARLLIGFKPPRLSPYLPYSFILDPSISEGFTVAVNRVADLRSSIKDRSIQGVKEAVYKVLPKIASNVNSILKRLESEIMVPYLGIDVSLAPMPGVQKESVGELLMYLSGDVQGVMSYIRAINSAIEEVPLRVPLVGYNRVMVPLGEDYVLASLAAEGKITLDTLKAWSSVCSTGVDVVPIRPGLTPRVAADTISIGLSQNKTIGVRVIPWDAGDFVDLGPIGKAPVLSARSP